jgi:hypothetical protein
MQMIDAPAPKYGNAVSTVLITPTRWMIPRRPVTISDRRR